MLIFSLIVGLLGLASGLVLLWVLVAVPSSFAVFSFSGVVAGSCPFGFLLFLGSYWLVFLFSFSSFAISVLVGNFVS